MSSCAILITLLEPIFHGEWATYGETLVGGTVSDACDAPQTMLLADFLADAKLVDDTLMCYAQRLKSRDPDDFPQVSQLSKLEV